MKISKKVVSINAPKNQEAVSNVSPKLPSTSVVELTSTEARRLFLKSESYSNFDLPSYFDFSPVLVNIDKILKGKNLSDLRKNSPRDHNDLNYKILSNKDGRYSWRPIQLIHPALYVSLVHKITDAKNWKIICDRYKQLSDNPQIECLSMPRHSNSKNSNKAEQVLYWWNNIEQRSIELSLDYDHIIHTDITDCYGSIYTHSVAWALHDKDFMKIRVNRDNNSLVGNIIDNHLQDMSHGQTNGIPQGSVLMDFIAELVLGYIDQQLTQKIGDKVTDYKILRYRDDYRIFTNNPRDAEKILKWLTEVTIGMGLKLSAEKTKSSDDMVKSAIKGDKLFWIKEKTSEQNLQKHLLIIHDLAMRYPNSGSLIKALEDYHNKLLVTKKYKHSTIPLIGIAVDIALKNPRSYPYVAAILSSLLSFIEPENQKLVIVGKIIKKLSHIPNTGHLEIWLQRVTLGFKEKYDFDEPLCQLVSGQAVEIWNTDWLNDKLSTAIKSSSIFNERKINKLPTIIPKKEIKLFFLHSL